MEARCLASESCWAAAGLSRALSWGAGGQHDGQKQSYSSESHNVLSACRRKAVVFSRR